METPDEKDGFHNATCWLPKRRWECISGYSDSDIKRLKKIIDSNSDLIIEFSRQCGFLNTENL